MLLSGKSLSYNRQVIMSLVFRSGAIASSFISFTMLIKYLDSETFGIWMTVLSILNWFTVFDLGIGNGIRNKLSELDYHSAAEKSQQIVIASFLILGLFTIFITATLIVMNYYISWQSVLNSTKYSSQLLRNLIFIVIFITMFNFWLNFINIVYAAKHQTHYVNAAKFISNLFLLFIISHMFSTPVLNLPHFAFWYLFSGTIGSLILISLYKWSWPLKVTTANFKEVYSYLGLGLHFFIIQICGMLIFTTDRILITQMLGPEFVPQFEIFQKLFSVFIILHSILLAPLWSLFASAKAESDEYWMTKEIYKQLKYFMIISVLVSICAFVSPYIITNWLGDEFRYQKTLPILFGLQIVLFMWNSIFSIVLNGLSDTKVQLLTSMITASLNIPLSILFCNYLVLDIAGVVLGTVVCLFISGITLFTRTRHMFKNHNEELQVD